MSERINKTISKNHTVDKIDSYFPVLESDSNTSFKQNEEYLVDNLALYFVSLARGIHQISKEDIQNT